LAIAALLCGTTALGVEAPPAGKPSDVKMHDTVVFTLSVGHGDRSPAERASATAEALQRAMAARGAEEVRVKRQGAAAVVFAGPVPVIELYEADATAAGSASLDAYASQIATRVDQTLDAERKRSAIAGTVFSVSLVVLFGLISLYVIRKVGEFAERARTWTLEHPDRVPAVRLQSLEVVGPAALRGGILATLLVGRWLAQLGVAYAWVVFTLSLFEATRPYTARLTGFVLTPLSGLAGRLAASLPLALVGVVFVVAVYVLVRFVQLFFQSVARRETKLHWLPAELAIPTGAVVRIGIVLAAVVFAAPIVTGDPSGALARAGSVALLSIGLAATPLLASGMVGVLLVYGRRLGRGEHAEIGGRIGKITDIGLLDVAMIDDDGCEVRVPHLLSLFHPTRRLGRRRRVAFEVAVASPADPTDVRARLLDVAARFGDTPGVELVDASAGTMRYRVRLAPENATDLTELRIAILDALTSGDIALASESVRSS
jgi:small-conductance mechanosensitive channel